MKALFGNQILVVGIVLKDRFGSAHTLIIIDEKN